MADTDLPTDRPPTPTAPPDDSPVATQLPRHLTVIQGGPDQATAPLPEGAPLPEPDEPAIEIPVPDLPAKPPSNVPLPPPAPRLPARAWQQDAVRQVLDMIGKDKNVVACTLANAVTILTLDHHWHNRIKLDDFGRTTKIEVPYGDEGHYPSEGTSNLTVSRTRMWLDHTYGCRIGVDDTAHALNAVAAENRMNPLTTYLDWAATQWDGKSRCRELLSGYMGADDTDLNAVLGLRFMISAVARAYQPGCKVDTMLILYGEQGIGKSTAVEMLAVDKSWHADTEIQFGSKDAYQALHGKWIYEMAEMSSFKQVNAKVARNFLTSKSDTFRAPYERAPRAHPRQTVFIGTTNVLNVIADATGSRRFWPVEVRQVDFDGLKKDINQLWGEAVAWYKAGEPWYLTRDEGRLLDAGLRGAAQRFDAWLDVIEDYVERRRPNSPVWVSDILTNALQIEARNQGALERARVEDCLRSMKYRTAPKDRMRVDGVQRRHVWLPPNWPGAE